MIIDNTNMGIDPATALTALQFVKDQPGQEMPDNTELKKKLIDSLTGATDWKVYATVGALGFVALGMLYLSKKRKK